MGDSTVGLFEPSATTVLVLPATLAGLYDTTRTAAAIPSARFQAVPLVLAIAPPPPAASDVRYPPCKRHEHSMQAFIKIYDSRHRKAERKMPTAHFFELALPGLHLLT